MERKIEKYYGSFFSLRRKIYRENFLTVSPYTEMLPLDGTIGRFTLLIGILYLDRKSVLLL